MDQYVPRLPSAARGTSLQPRHSCCNSASLTGHAAAKTPSPTSRNDKNKIRASVAPQEGDIVQVLYGATIDDEPGGIVPAWWLGKVATVHPLGAFHAWLEASDAIEPFDASLVCSAVDDDCMDTAEQYDGWMRSANGSYMHKYESELEFYEVDESYVDALDDETDDEIA